MTQRSSFSSLLLETEWLAVGVTALVVLTVGADRLVRRRRAARHISDNDNDPPPSGMPLSFVQQYFLDGQAQGVDHVVCTVRIRGRIPSRHEMEHAICRSKRRHSSLSLVLTVNEQEQQASDDDGNVKTRNNNKKEKKETYQLSVEPKVISGSLTVVDDARWSDVAHHCLNTIQFPKPTLGKPTPTWKVWLVTNHKNQTENDGSNNKSNNSSNEDEHGAAVILVLSHLLFDGTSRNRLIHELFSNLPGRNCKSQSLDNDRDSPPPALPMNVQQVHNQLPSLSWSQFGALAWRHIARTLWGPKPWFFPLDDAPGLRMAETTTTTENETPDGLVKKETKQILVSLDKATTSKIVEQCRTEQTSMHGAITAAAHVALVRLAQERQPMSQSDENDDERKPTTASRSSTPPHRLDDGGYYFASLHLISWWPLVNPILAKRDNNPPLPPQDPPAGVFIDTSTAWVRTFVPRDDNDENAISRSNSNSQKANNSWNLARDILNDQDLARRRRDPTPMSIAQHIVLELINNLCVSLLTAIGSNDKALPESYRKLERKRSAQLYISNNGRLDYISTHGYGGEPKTHIQSIFATNARHLASGALGIWNIQTVHGQIHAGWSYYSHVWSDETANHYVQLFQEELGQRMIMS